MELDEKDLTKVSYLVDYRQFFWVKNVKNFHE